MRYQRRPWTPAEKLVVRDLYPDVPTADIAALLGRLPGSVYQLAASLGIKKSAYFWQSDRTGRIERGKHHPAMVGQQFQPGHMPWNKGQRWAAGGRSVSTRFQPGNRPHTELPVGSYRLVAEKNGSQHLERKTSTHKGASHKRWTPVTRLVWEAAHGPVAPRHICVFKPGMHTVVLEQITLERIECISRKEHARRNSPYSISLELGRLYQLKGAIMRQVNRIAQMQKA